MSSPDPETPAKAFSPQEGSNAHAELIAERLSAFKAVTAWIKEQRLEATAERKRVEVKIGANSAVAKADIEDVEVLKTKFDKENNVLKTKIDGKAGIEDMEVLKTKFDTENNVLKTKIDGKAGIEDMEVLKTKFDTENNVLKTKIDGKAGIEDMEVLKTKIDGKANADELKVLNDKVEALILASSKKKAAPYTSNKKAKKPAAASATKRNRKARNSFDSHDSAPPMQLFGPWTITENGINRPCKKCESFPYQNYYCKAHWKMGNGGEE